MLGILAALAPLLPGFLLSLAHDQAAAATATATNDTVAKKEVQLAAIKAEVDRRNVQRDIIVAEQGRWYTAAVRPAFALIFILYFAKVVVWDKVLALGVTDDLSPELWGVAKVILGAYFIGRSAEKIARTAKR